MLTLANAAFASEDSGVRVIIGGVAATAAGSRADIEVVVMAIAMAVADHAGYHGDFEDMPYSRALAETQQHDNVLILPIARTPAREAHFQWLIPLFEDGYVIVTRPNTAPILGGKAKIGVVRSSAAEEVAKDLGYENLEQSIDDLQNIAMLMHGHIGAWIASRARATLLIREAGYDPGEFNVSILPPRYTIYLAASPRLDAAEGERWRAAGEAVRSDGTLDALLRQYPIQ